MPERIATAAIREVGSEARACSSSRGCSCSPDDPARLERDQIRDGSPPQVNPQRFNIRPGRVADAAWMRYTRRPRRIPERMRENTPFYRDFLTIGGWPAPCYSLIDNTGINNEEDSFNDTHSDDARDGGNVLRRGGGDHSELRADATGAGGNRGASGQRRSTRRPDREEVGSGRAAERRRHRRLGRGGRRHVDR